MNSETIFAVTRFNKIKKDTIDSHIKQCESSEEAIKLPNFSFLVIKKGLPGENVPGGSFFCPNVYNYKIVDRNNDPFFIQYGNGICDDYIIKTLRSAYYDESGSGDISFTDRNGDVEKIDISAGFDKGISIIRNLVNFLIEFEEKYNSDWKLYRIKNELDNTIKSLEEKLKNASLQITMLKKKIKDLRKKHK
jgi:hypothetical protein